MDSLRKIQKTVDYAELGEADLDSLVAEMLIKEAKEKETKYSSYESEERSNRAPLMANKRFIGNVVRNMASHNLTLDQKESREHYSKRDKDRRHRKLLGRDNHDLARTRERSPDPPRTIGPTLREWDRGKLENGWDLNDDKQ
jgi:hypothetical protein